MTYALDTKIGLCKILFICYYNKPSCQSIEPEFFRRELFRVVYL